MAKIFYTASEAAERVNKTEEELKDLVRAGELREFRDAGTVSYKVEDIDAIAGSATMAVADDEAADTTSGSGSGEIVLEPVDDSGIDLSPSGSDVISLDDSDASASGTGAPKKEKEQEGTVVPSVGVNVFDDDELDEQVDPLAQTAVTDVAGLGIEGAGSGSGILDLTRESDDTSLGRELLDEIYTGDGEKAGTGEAAVAAVAAAEGEATVEMGDDTRAGLAEVAPEPTAEEEAEPVEAETEAESATAPQTRTVVREVVEYGPDAVSNSLTALMIVAVAVMWFAFLGAAALVRGITPALLQGIYANLWMYAAGALGVGVIAAAATYFMVKKRSG